MRTARSDRVVGLGEIGQRCVHLFIGAALDQRYNRSPGVRALPLERADTASSSARWWWRRGAHAWLPPWRSAVIVDIGSPRQWPARRCCGDHRSRCVARRTAPSRSAPSRGAEGEVELGLADFRPAGGQRRVVEQNRTYEARLRACPRRSSSVRSTRRRSRRRCARSATTTPCCAVEDSSEAS